jgi:hypothetical protein
LAYDNTPCHDQPSIINHQSSIIITEHSTQNHKATIRKETMVTFTLTPTNAASIPRNVVHLIVAEGVTEIPDGLCHRDGKGFESLETIVFSKSVTVIGSGAF